MGLIQTLITIAMGIFIFVILAIAIWDTIKVRIKEIKKEKEEGK